MAQNHAMLTVAETEALFDRAFEEYDASHEDEDDDFEVDADRELQALTAMLYATSVAAIHRSPSLISHVATAMRCIADRDYYDLEDTPRELLQALIAVAGPAHAEVHALADDDAKSVRVVLANSLDPASEGGRKLLESLVLDDEPDVSAAARGRLGASRSAWWVGIFSRDPAELIPTPELSRLQPVLTAIAAIVDLPAAPQHEKADVLAKLAAKLPDPLLHDLALRVLWTPEQVKGHEPLLTVAVRRAGGSDTVLSLLDIIGEGFDIVVIAKFKSALRKVPKARRRLLARQLIERAVALAPPAEGLGSAYHLADLGGHLLDPADRLWALEALAAHPEFQATHAAKEVQAAIADVRPPRRLLLRVVALHRDGYPGFDDARAKRFDAMLLTAPASLLRPLAEVALRSDDPHRLTWGLEAMITRSNGLAPDQERADVIRTLWEEPRFRRALLGHRTTGRYILPFLRPLLRAGELDIKQARVALGAIYDLYDEEVHGVHHDPPMLRQELRDLLGPAALQGPLNDDDRRGYRVIRDRTLASPGFDWSDIEWLPSATGLDDADQPALDAVTAAVAAGDEHAAMSLWRLAREVPSPQLIEPLIAMYRTAPTKPTRYWTWASYRHLHHALKIDLPDKPRRDAQATTAGEPADDDEDDDWLDD